MKKIIIILITIIFFIGCSDKIKIGNLILKKHHSTHVISEVENQYELYSCWWSYSDSIFDDANGSIEYMIHPTFKGTKLECELKKIENEKILNEWLINKISNLNIIPNAITNFHDYKGYNNYWFKFHSESNKTIMTITKDPMSDKETDQTIIADSFFYSDGYFLKIDKNETEKIELPYYYHEIPEPRIEDLE